MYMTYAFAQHELDTFNDVTNRHTAFFNLRQLCTFNTASSSLSRRVFDLKESSVCSESNLFWRGTRK